MKIREGDYQYGFSDKGTAMFDVPGRQRKAKTMMAVFKEHIGAELNSLSLLNVGGSAGIIDEYLSKYFAQVISIDIDEKAVEHAKTRFQNDNLSFQVGDAMSLNFESAAFDVAVCSQVYEHVPDSGIMMKEIFRILKPGGCCYFAAGNRLMFNEPHYNLPLLSVIPRQLAHKYVKLTGKGDYYYEKHLTYWGLKKLVSNFELVDYTKPIVLSPGKYQAEYMVREGSKKQRLASLIVKYAMWLMPGYIWMLQKPARPI